MGGDEGGGTGRSGIDPMYSGGSSGTTGAVGYDPYTNWLQGADKGLGSIGSGFSQDISRTPQSWMPSFPGEQPIGDTESEPFQPIPASQTNAGVSMDDIIQMLAKLGINL
jgi:hypothetical protein